MLGVTPPEDDTGEVAVTEPTPAFGALMLMPPGVFTIRIFAPAVKVARVKPVPLPISNCPFDGVDDKPVPPLATPTTPVTLPALPEILPDTAAPEIAIVVLVTLVT